MKNIGLLLFVISSTVLMPGFQCGDPYPECRSFSNDSIPLPFNVSGNTAAFHIGDTIYFSSMVSDTNHTSSGKIFTFENEQITAVIQPYRVIPGATPVLNFANNEFNPVLIEGTFNNYGTGGTNIRFNRVAPYNRMMGGLVAGREGLYIIKADASTYIHEPGNNCAGHLSLFDIPAGMQRNSFWASLGTQNLTLAQSSGWPLINSAQKDYFFIEVIP